MFSIIIPTLNNLDYLKLCLKSLKKNSNYSHQIIVHVNIGGDETLDFLQNENIDHTFTKYNAGICEGMNMASKKQKMISFYMLMMTFIFAQDGIQRLLEKLTKLVTINFIYQE